MNIIQQYQCPCCQHIYANKSQAMRCVKNCKKRERCSHIWDYSLRTIEYALEAFRTCERCNKVERRFLSPQTLDSVEFLRFVKAEWEKEERAFG